MACVPDSVPAHSSIQTVYRTRVGRPNKFEEPWITVNKRIYILTTTLEELREIKEAGQLASDDEAVQYLLQRHKKLRSMEEQASTRCGEDWFCKMITIFQIFSINPSQPSNCTSNCTAIDATEMQQYEKYPGKLVYGFRDYNHVL